MGDKPTHLETKGATMDIDMNLVLWMIAAAILWVAKNFT